MQLACYGATDTFVVRTPLTAIVTIGLPINELVTKAAKHGSGKIDVAWRVNHGLHELRVCDQGEGPASRRQRVKKRSEDRGASP